ncbi:DgyrCDS13021 [Dimorphilus gyrociliatus]|uniref:DgyrCDS13021 n=1 Tax=Dimorphilus gyrociliatus TaxID=2664684 RepID=A0A7I8W9G9_9ANNE|nr:DgyrCDS13021 [Dimorphilus gyrociliatus]
MKTFILLAALLFAAEAAPQRKSLTLSVHAKRIVNGVDAVKGSWPWQVSVQACTAGFCTHNCGGSIINAEWVLTAAHCITNPDPEAHRLVFGLHDRSDESESLIRKPTVIRPHEDFINDGFLAFPNDVGVLKVDSPLDLARPNISPAKLVSADVGPLDGTECTITGWGRLYGGGPIPEILQQATTRVLSNDDCISQGIGQAQYQYHICVNDDDGSNGSCNGDSGGPLNCPVGNDQQVAGVASFVVTGCSVTAPAGYARVSEYISWIEENTQ